MKRRSSTGGGQITARRRKTVTLKRRNVPKPTPDRGLTTAGLQEQLHRRTNELNEALEQQAATSEVLRVISSSPGDLKPAFAVILENATRLCQANFGALYLCEGDAYRAVAMHNAPPAFVDAKQREPLVSMTGSTVLAHVARTKRTVQTADITKDPAYQKNPQNTRLFARLTGARSVVEVPMLKDNELVGAIVIFRQEVRPFTDKQIALVENFAAQAVIAIENARLLNELRQRTTDLTERTADLTEALEQQTATSEVLQVISSFPGDLEPVFAAMLENAVRICDAEFGNIYRWDGEALHLLATHNTPPPFAEARRRSPARPTSHMLRMVETKAPSHIADFAAGEDYIKRNPGAVAAVELGGVRTFLAVPMLKENEMIGSFSLYRQEVRPFTDRQIALVTNFAAQAVIAIENARLLNELRQSLEQQTATSEVLQVISGSPGDLQPVFESLLRNATRLCKAKFGTLYVQEEGGLRLVAAHDMPAAFSRAHGSVAHEPSPGGVLEGATRTKHPVQIADLAATAAYRQRHPRMVEAVELGGIRTAVAVPMLKDDEPIGVISINRPEVASFDEKQIALLTNFAAQAVIAIENARLLNELRQRTTDLTERTADLTEALEQQTATSEVLQVISSSPGDLEPVFASMLKNAVRICDAKFGNIYRWDGQAFHLLETHNAPPAYAKARRSSPVAPPHPKSLFGGILATKSVIHFIDDMAEEGYLERVPSIVAAVELGGVRTALGVPMLREDDLIGAFTLFRQEVRPFTDKQIELVQNFAAQAVIAIENTRLLNELRERTQEVVKLNQHLEQRVSDQVGEIERMGRLRRFLPPQVADLIVASGTEKQLESHRREITALFCDLRGFTGFTESADAEDVMALLRDYHAAIGEIIIKYSGTLERYAGDGVMVVFNDPVPVDNPALQAVLMALELRDALGALTATWSRLGHEIGFGIGIAHGFATLGTIGFEGRFDYAAIGTVSNVASRLCDEAKPGQILISPRVLMKVENAVTVEPVGEFALKGIRRPLAAYNVLAALQGSD
jgi:GAF domain-containing protein